MRTLANFIRAFLRKTGFLLGIARFLRNTFLKFAFKVRYPTTYYLNREHLSTIGVYSQAGQDGFIYNKFFAGQETGIFCDIGGNHPIKINNTYFFEQQGWQGYVFEPLPKMEKLWRDKRMAEFFPYAASSEEKELQFAIVDLYDGALSYVTDTLNHDIPIDAKHTQMTVQARPVKDVFQEHKITHIDYMSIDVEGHELEVLKGIDFKAVRINVISMENNPDLTIWGDIQGRQILLDNGFVFYARIPMLDDIYVHADFLKTIQK